MNIQAINNNFFPQQFDNNTINSPSNSLSQRVGPGKEKFAKEIAQKIFNQAGNPSTLSSTDFASILSNLSPKFQNKINTATTQNINGIQSPTNNSSSAVENTNTSPATIDTNAFSQFAKQFDIDDNGLDKTELAKLIESLPEPPHHGKHHKDMRDLNNLAKANGGSFTLDQLKADITAKMSADPNKTIDTAIIDAMAQKLFSKLDVDGDGKVTTAEITALQDQMKTRFANSQQNNLDATNPNGSGKDLSSLTSGLTDPSSLASLTGGLFGSDTSSTNSSSLGQGTDLTGTNTPTDSTLLG